MRVQRIVLSAVYTNVEVCLLGVLQQVKLCVHCCCRRSPRLISLLHYFFWELRLHFADPTPLIFFCSFPLLLCFTSGKNSQDFHSLLCLTRLLYLTACSCSTAWQQLGIWASCVLGRLQATMYRKVQDEMRPQKWDCQGLEGHRNTWSLQQIWSWSKVRE